MEHGHGTEMAPEAVSGMSMDEKMHASVGMEMWSGATSFACSSAAAWRAGWLVAIFMVATPWALVAYNRATAAAAACVAAGGAGVDEHMKRRHVAVVVHCAVAALALFLGFFAEGGLRECYGTTYFIDDGLKWLLVAVNCLVAVALALTSASPPAPAPAASPTPSLSSGVGFGGGRSALAGARDALMALTRRSALLWGYTYAVAALSVFLSVTGVWGHMQVRAAAPRGAPAAARPAPPGSSDSLSPGAANRRSASRARPSSATRSGTSARRPCGSPRRSSCCRPR